MERSSDTVAPDSLGTGEERAVARAWSNRAGIAGASNRRRRPGRARRWLVVAVGIVALAGVAYAVIRGKAQSYVLATARDGTVTQTIGVSGTLQPTRSWDLYFATAGTIAQLDVTSGQHVHAGQVLTVLDTRPLETQLASAQAGVAAAQAKLDADQATPAKDYAAASAQTTADQDALTAAEDQLTTAQTNLAGATLRAPAAATVAQVNVATGQNIGGGGGGGGGGAGAGAANAGGSSQPSASASAAATSTAGAPSAAITLEDSRSFEAAGQVSDTQIAQVHLHQQALVTPAGQTDAIHGQVTTITPTPSSTNGVIAYPVEITWTGHPQGLLDGMSAQISIVVTKVSGLTVPSSAVHTDGARNWVLVMHGATTRNGRARGGQATLQPIDVGPSGGGVTEVRFGLKAGEQIVLADNSAPLPSASSPSQGKTGKGSEVRKLFGG